MTLGNYFTLALPCGETVAFARHSVQICGSDSHQSSQGHRDQVCVLCVGLICLCALFPTRIRPNWICFRWRGRTLSIGNIWSVPSCSQARQHQRTRRANAKPQLFICPEKQNKTIQKKKLDTSRKAQCARTRGPLLSARSRSSEGTSPRPNLV